MKTVYVNPNTQSIIFLSQTIIMTGSSDYANPQGEGGTPVMDNNKMC